MDSISFKNDYTLDGNAQVIDWTSLIDIILSLLLVFILMTAFFKIRESEIFKPDRIVLAQLQSKNYELTDQLNIIRQDFNIARLEFAEAQQLIVQLRSENSSISDQLLMAEEKLTILAEKKERLVYELNTLKQTYDNLLDELKDKIEYLKKMNSEMNEKIEHFEKSNTNLLDSTENDLKQLEIINKLRNEIEKVKAENKELKRNNDDKN